MNPAIHSNALSAYISSDYGGWYPWGTARNEPEIDVNDDPQSYLLLNMVTSYKYDKSSKTQHEENAF